LALTSKPLAWKMDGSKFGMGTRGQRFAIIVKKLVLQTQVGCRGRRGEFKVSAAEYVLRQL